jgi:hypothetical protein
LENRDTETDRASPTVGDGRDNLDHGSDVYFVADYKRAIEMILFYCLLMALAICYWATLFDPKHRRLHSSAFIVLLLATGWERWQSEHDAAKEIMIADVPQTEYVGAISASINAAYEKGKQQWLANKNWQNETQLGLISKTP